MERYLLTALIGFALGTLALSYHESNVLPVFAALLAATLACLFLVRREKAFLLAGILLGASALGMANVERATVSLPEALRPHIESEIVLEGVIIADPDVRETSQRLTLKAEKEGVDARILVVAPLYPEVRYGERIRAEGKLSLPESFSTDGGRTFAYDKFLAKDGVVALLENAQVEVIEERTGFAHLRGALSDFKFDGIESLAKALPEPQASLAAGLILGGKQGLGASLLDDFIASGLVHIVVLSGYNVMIVAEFVLRAFQFLPQRLSAGLGIFTILGFVLAAGAGAASVRAGIMAGIAVFARASGRTYDATRALLLAGFLMVLVSPYTLAFDPGFQLSFVATLGLIFGAPLVARRLAFIRSEFFREIASSTVAAQVSVLPLLLYQNGLFSLVALPANLLVLPIVPLAMLLSALAGLAGSLVPIAAPVLSLPAYVLLSYVIGVVEVSADLPLATLSIPAFPFVVVVLSYALLTALVVRELRRPGERAASRRRSS